MFILQCGEISGDYNIQIPNQFLGAQTVCNPGFNDCSTTPAGSPGAPNTDFLMFISAANIASRCSGGTAAYALACQRDEYDRPTVGRANFCPTKIDLDEQEQMIGIAVHEILHALGMSRRKLQATVTNAEELQVSRRAHGGGSAMQTWTR